MECSRILRFRPASPTMLSVALLLIAGCNVDYQNWTPAAFPFDWTSDGPTANKQPLYPSTPAALASLADPPVHRFLLELKPNNVTIRSVSIVVNGAQHAMMPVTGASQLYSYQSPNECTPQYSYYMTVEYRVSAPYAVGPAEIGTSQQPLVANVAGFGALAWWVKGTEALTSNGTIRLVQGTGDAPVVLQNLSSSRKRIRGFGFSTTDPDAAKFSAVDRPTLPAILNCGQKAEFKVRWAPTAGDYNDQTDMLIMTDTEISPGNWRTDPSPLLIRLQGVPHPG